MRHACVLLLTVFLVAPAAGGETASTSRQLTFERDVRPILKVHCTHCHGEAGEEEGGLDLRLRRLIVSGGDSGAAIDLQSPHESLLLARLRSGEMPPGEKKLPPHDITTIERWIEQGAATASEEPESIGDDGLVTDEDRQFWSFRTIAKPQTPHVRHAKLVRTPIDAFIIQKLEENGLSFSKPAGRRTLIRRATFDLLGLPPTPEEVDAFVADKKAAHTNVSSIVYSIDLNTANAGAATGSTSQATPTAMATTPPTAFAITPTSIATT